MKTSNINVKNQTKGVYHKNNENSIFFNFYVFFSVTKRENNPNQNSLKNIFRKKLFKKKKKKINYVENALIFVVLV